eukprot:2485973-Lingulodinium_polyedra.AAC.1
MSGPCRESLRGAGWCSGCCSAGLDVLAIAEGLAQGVAAVFIASVQSDCGAETIRDKLPDVREDAEVHVQHVCQELELLLALVVPLHTPKWLHAHRSLVGAGGVLQEEVRPPAHAIVRNVWRAGSRECARRGEHPA